MEEKEQYKLNTETQEEVQLTALAIIFPLVSYEITEPLSTNELIRQLRLLNDVYKSRKMMHRKGGLYIITDACIIHKDGKSWWGLEYSPYKNGEPALEIKHTRTIEEMADGRFITH